MKHLGISVFILHYLIALLSAVALLSIIMVFEVPMFRESGILFKSTTRLILDFGFFLTLGLSTHWSVFRADRRVQKLFLLLSATVLMLYVLNHISILNPIGQ